MFLAGIVDHLVFEHLQPPDQLAAGLARRDHVVDVAVLGGHVGVGKLLAIRVDESRFGGFRVFGLGQLLANPTRAASKKSRRCK